MIQELPSISSSSYYSAPVDSTALLTGQAITGSPSQWALDIESRHKDGVLRWIDDRAKNHQPAAAPARQKEPKVTARIVKVYIADPTEDLPLESRVLHSGDEQLTDLTDQELFFEIPIADLLKKHNDKRKLTIDKKATAKLGREVYLEPVRIRDLKMVVVTVAAF